MDATSNLSLPFIVAAQAQKHITHNEALRALDAVVQLAVLDKDLAAPPGSPSEGTRYIVAAGPAGAWAGHADSIAAFQDGAWAFYDPQAGWRAWVADEARLYLWSGSAWVPLPLVCADGEAIADEAGNAQIAFHTAASAVNHIALANAATAAGPRISAEGADSDIDLRLSPKGTGAVRTSAQLSVSSAVYPPLSAERTTGSTNAPLSPHRLLATTTGDMADGFGAILGFSIRDNAGVINEGIATVRALRSGADNSGRLQLTTLNAGSEVVGHEMAPAGNNYFPNVATTASAANAVLNSASTPANELLRSTSSRRYKRQIEDLESRYAESVLKLRPVWYRSAIASDRQDWSHYGLIAEEVAEIDPRLVHWGHRDDDWETPQANEDGATSNERRLRMGAPLVPDGVAYERLTVLLLSLVKHHHLWIEALTASFDKSTGRTVTERP
jgi:hypothetical protein